MSTATLDLTHNVKQKAAHPFELAGMGRGPYAWVGFIELPDLAEASAANFGNADPYAEIRSYNLKAGAGACACCGAGIRNVCIVRDADGGNWGVGCDCAEKTGDPALGDKAKIEIARKQRRQRQARADKQRAARREVWLDTVCWTGETNARRLDREASERQAVKYKAAQALNARATALADILANLEGSGGDFYPSLARQLRAGPLSARQAECVAKSFFNRRARKNGDAYDAIVGRCTAG